MSEPCRQDAPASRNPVSYWSALGLAALYCSGFVFPLVRLPGAYLHTSLWNGLILPTLVALLFVTLMVRLGGAWLGKYKNNTFVPHIARFGLTLFLMIGLRGFAASTGYSLGAFVLYLNDGNTDLKTVQNLKAVVLLLLFCVILAALYRIAWPNDVRRVVRFVTALGFSLFGLAVLNASWLIVAERPQMDITSLAPKPVVSSAPRRVVWVIFDELDYRLAMVGGAKLSPSLNNFKHLAENSVAAQQAFSPSDSTSTSIPSLLMGIQTAGAKVLGPANQKLIDLNGNTVPFSQKNTLLGRLRKQGKQFSVLGFFHPYCVIFVDASQCAVYPSASWYSALVDWIPGRFIRTFSINEIMAQVSAWQQSALSGFLWRTQDSLTYIHLNVPHLPGYYALKHFGQTGAEDDHAQYAANLSLADEFLGQIIGELARVSVKQDVLLIVSGDHGFRLLKKFSDDSRPVPWLAWRVGAHDGHAISAPISTVHTASLIEDFLNEKVSTQAEIAEWWQGKPVLPRLTDAPKEDND